MNWKKRFWSDEKGAALPMVVGMLLLILAFASLVVDAGVLYADRRQMVTAADAGALAGAQTLEESKGLDVSTAISTAVEYAIKNGADTASAVVATKSVMIQNQADTRQVITVTVNENQNLFFAKIFGENEAYCYSKGCCHLGVYQKCRWRQYFTIVCQGRIFHSQPRQFVAC